MHILRGFHIARIFCAVVGDCVFAFTRVYVYFFTMSNERRYLLPLTVSLCLIVFLGLWVTYEFLYSYSDEIVQQRKNAGELRGILKAALLISSENGKAESARLSANLKNFIELSGISQITIKNDSGTPVSVYSQNELPLSEDSPQGQIVRKGKMIVWDTVNSPSEIVCRTKDGFLGNKGTTIVYKAPFLLYFVLDASDSGSEAAYREGLVQTVAVLGAGVIIILFITWSISMRNRKLMLRLKEIETKKEQAEELSLAAAGLAHETKNPLGVIRGLAQQIADNARNLEPAREKAKEIMEQADVTTARLGDFLSYARQRSPEPADVKAIDFLEHMKMLVSDDFRSENVKLSVEADDITIFADKEMLSQILLNLLLNSLKSSAAGGETKIILRETSRGSARLAVTDTGGGISPEILPHIFKPYTSRRVGGCGMGLAIVKRLVEQSGWLIEVKSKPGSGTKIFINDIKVLN
ncbi:MAG: hypothetical protein A2020_13215 [Lentisphaerae bacterium GWF2_45_14]|nr:MAG: hypothetical protein A2020_13215 [Lentisphaerae bacterium GWF2_45_14]